MIEGGAKSFGRRTFHPEDRQDREETYLYNPQTCRPRASDHTLLSNLSRYRYSPGTPSGKLDRCTVINCCDKLAFRAMPCTHTHTHSHTPTTSQRQPNKVRTTLAEGGLGAADGGRILHSDGNIGLIRSADALSIRSCRSGGVVVFPLNRCVRAVSLQPILAPDHHHYSTRMTTAPGWYTLY